MPLNDTFQALADPSRRRILEILKKGDKPVSVIAESFDMTMPSISHHLSILKNADLVTTQRNGQQIIYSLNLSVFEEVAKELYEFFNHKKRRK